MTHEKDRYSHKHVLVGIVVGTSIGDCDGMFDGISVGISVTIIGQLNPPILSQLIQGQLL